LSRKEATSSNGCPPFLPWPIIPPRIARIIDCLNGHENENITCGNFFELMKRHRGNLFPRWCFIILFHSLPAIVIAHHCSENRLENRSCHLIVPFEHSSSHRDNFHIFVLFWMSFLGLRQEFWDSLPWLFSNILPPPMSDEDDDHIFAGVGKR
jgi:hypothetical protein